ncbi:Chlorophyllase [Cynara cardunculus var. scolymus]|uniref:Chlorophyllase n=1 Tax=Cynara cardunculus var. scolymus TaxID=59895 RepID=A0A103YMK3_CYNCS|nr:Chlorophyllase [Cynara cardunculus var. scolymus]
MSHSSSVGVSSKIDVFGIGEHEIKVVKVADDATTPKSLLIFTPLEAGEFPVLLREPWNMEQLHLCTGSDATEEIEDVVAISNWLPEGLQKFLPSGVHADLKKLGLAGHNKGGKEAFAIALNKFHTKLNLKFSALIGIDPVDGTEVGKQTQPKILTYVPHSFNLGMPVMVIGSGLGEIKRNPLFPACAPKGVSHEEFYKECRKPACYFVVKDYGHLDVLDDETKGIVGKFANCMCKNGKSREPMRRFVGGAVVAFLKAYFEGDFGYLMTIKDEANGLVVLQKVDFQL